MPPFIHAQGICRRGGELHPTTAHTEWVYLRAQTQRRPSVLQYTDRGLCLKTCWTRWEARRTPAHQSQTLSEKWNFNTEKYWVFSRESGGFLTIQKHLGTRTRRNAFSTRLLDDEEPNTRCLKLFSSVCHIVIKNSTNFIRSLKVKI